MSKSRFIKKSRFLGFTAKTLSLLGLIISQSIMAGTWQNNQSVGGFSKVHIYTPESQSEIGEGKALLIVLHGCTQSIDAFKTANLEAAADQYGMVIAVPDAMNKAGFSCWSYWQGTKSRSSGDYKNLISLANTLSGDISKNIDANQVYIAGLSSGAAFANTTACLAPDVFAGMGISAGPSIGTSSNGAISTCESADVTTRCNNYAGSYKSHLDNQIASIAHGDADTTVNTCYNEQNANGMAGVYGVSQLGGSSTISEGTGHTAEEFMWSNDGGETNRVSMLWLHGLDHAWSGGAGASGSYVGSASINYASYLGQYFKDNNQRVSRNEAPTIDSVNLSSSADVIIINGSASDTDGTVGSIDVLVEGLNGSTFNLQGGVDGSGHFSITSASVADDLYQVTIVATDNEGASTSPVYKDTVRVGPPPPPAAPVLSNVTALPTAQCVLISGEVIDVNQDPITVTIDVAAQQATSAVESGSFSAQFCDLAGGDHAAQVTAADDTGLSSFVDIDFTIDAGQTANLDQHISAGRLDYTNYANCYLEYSTAAFRLDETSVGGQCQWQDDDASCVGPLQACSSAGGGSGGDDSGGGGDTDPVDPVCEDVSAYNYYHKTGGRAYSNGNPLSPDYFAVGSNEVMAGSTWGLTTLNSVDGGNEWRVGACP